MRSGQVAQYRAAVVASIVQEGQYNPPPSKNILFAVTVMKTSIHPSAFRWYFVWHAEPMQDCAPLFDPSLPCISSSMLIDSAQDNYLPMFEQVYLKIWQCRIEDS